MRTLPSSLDTEKDAAQSGWAEVVDLYLKESITTPFGSTNVLRMTNVPGGVAFFKPTVPPEPDGTQGDAADYFYWPWKRAAVRSSNKNAADRMTFTASNVTTDFAQMLADVSFYDCWIVVRKISTSIAGAAASDCVVLFIGQVDSWNTTPEQVQFNVSGDLTALNIVLPRENMHQNCRFNWADDFCTKLRWHADHFKAKTCGASSTTTQINSAGLTEDAGGCSLVVHEWPGATAPISAWLRTRGYAPGPRPDVFQRTLSRGRGVQVGVMRGGGRSLLIFVGAGTPDR